MRCLTLADGLADRGAQCHFLCGPLPSNCAQDVVSRGHGLITMPVEAMVSEQVDAEATVAALKGRHWDWVVVDHYGLAARWETLVQARAERLLVIDDLADREHRCDVLLDQNYRPGGDACYREKVPTTCRILAGPRFALLRPEYERSRGEARSRGGGGGRLFVFFGGADPCGLTELTLSVLSDDCLSHLAVDVVCVSGPSRLRRLVRQAGLRPGTTVHGPRPHLADLMAKADLAIGGGGSTTWERLCLGLPSIIVTMAENQREVTGWLHGRGLVRFIGDSGRVSAEQIRAGLMEETRREFSLPDREARMQVCDGLGASRVVAAMFGAAQGVQL
jgi:UDP-2,4-diacetamido-2,4,6-trideoxy-beta-L-altropyranose hydrolase